MVPAWMVRIVMREILRKSIAIEEHPLAGEWQKECDELVEQLMPHGIRETRKHTT